MAMAEAKAHETAETKAERDRLSCVGAVEESAGSSEDAAGVLPAASAAGHVIPRASRCPRQPTEQSGLRTAGAVPAAVAA